jgi:hypothetical protein
MVLRVDLALLTSRTRHVKAKRESNCCGSAPEWTTVPVHHGVTVALQITGMVRPWGKVVLTGVQWRVVVQHLGSAKTFINDPEIHTTSWLTKTAARSIHLGTDLTRVLAEGILTLQTTNERSTMMSPRPPTGASVSKNQT